MKNKILLLFVGLGLLCSSVFFTGCASKGDLAPSGVYQGDAVTFNADVTITSTYTLFDSYVTWEYKNRAALATFPAATKLADNIRANAKHWFTSAEGLRDAYAASPTAENRANLQKALAVLQAALLEASTYMAQPIPNTAK